MLQQVTWQSLLSFSTFPFFAAVLLPQSSLPLFLSLPSSFCTKKRMCFSCQYNTSLPYPSIRQICAVTMGMNTLSHRWMSDSNFFASLTIRFVRTPTLWPSCCCCGMFTYLSYRCILQDRLLCCVLSSP